MELKDLQDEWIKKTKGVVWARHLVDIFQKLCGKAQELIFEAYENKNINFQAYWCSNEQLFGMTPIEQVYYVAFLIYQYSEFEFPQKFKLSFFPSPQAEIKCKNKTYRTDFLFEDFLQFSGITYFYNPVIVECDGFEYHSTKQQRNADTERENDLKMNGYKVIRFTGSQIYKDPYFCVMQTIKFIYDENKEQLKEFFEVKS